MRDTFWNKITPIIISTGLVPAAGTCSKTGLKNNARRNNTPATTALKPVLAPSLIDADDSGETKMGAEDRSPATIVNAPHIM